MKHEIIPVDGNVNFYVELPEKIGEEGIVIELHISPSMHGKHFNVAIEEIAPVYKLGEKRATIPGHPNCYYGECYDCHVVSCAIQQGWADIPKEE